MSQSVDFKAIKDSVSMERAVQLLGLKMRRQGDQLRSACTCGTGGDRALAINVAKASFYCFGAKAGGDVISLAAHVRNEGLRDAAIFLAGQTAPRAEAALNRSQPPAKPESGLKPLEYLEPEHEAVEVIGFSVEDARALGIGYCPKGILRGTVAIPLRTEDGVLVGYAGATELVLPPKLHFPEQKIVAFTKKA